VKRGKTHALVQRCLEQDGVLICHSHQYAKQLEKQYPGLKAMALTDTYKLQGRHVDTVIDHYVYEEIRSIKDGEKLAKWIKSRP